MYYAGLAVDQATPSQTRRRLMSSSALGVYVSIACVVMLFAVFFVSSKS